MASTLLLTPSTWDLTLDANNNIAVAADPYSLAQDAASAIKTFLGECYWDTAIGVDYDQILGKKPASVLIKQQFEAAADTVPGVASSQVFLSSLADRALSGQVQVSPEGANPNAQPAFANFSVPSPQGSG